MFRGKKYQDAAKQIEKNAQYDAAEGFGLICKTASAKFDETVELHVKLGVDSRHADQQVRGAIVLPNGTGKNVRVLVFAKGDKAEAAKAAGADYVGDMDLVEKYVTTDPTVKGIWCVPKYSNPTGNSYSDQTVRRLARMHPAAPDFRIYWDNAYGIHHLYDDEQDHVLEILAECKKAGNPDMVYKFCSTSKITFPGSGVAAIATSANNLEDIKKQLKIQTIGHDKVNQLRHVRFFKDIHGITEHMRKHADSLRPKFEMILDTFERELKGLGAGSWYSPKGGYFITYETLDGCAKNVVAKAKKAGVVMTPAGAPFPYGKDPHDSVIRISPSYPSLEDLTTAIDIFVVCVKLASIEKLLGE